jgi:hypothetical protein
MLSMARIWLVTTFCGIFLRLKSQSILQHQPQPTPTDTSPAPSCLWSNSFKERHAFQVIFFKSK